MSGALLRTYRRTFQTLDLGGVKFQNVPIALAEFRGPELILGMHELRFMRLYLAYRERKLYVTATPPEIVATDAMSVLDLVWRARNQAVADNYDAAFAALERAIALNPTLDLGYAARASLKSMRGDYAGSVADFAQAIARKPKEAAHYKGRGMTYLSIGEYVNAAADYTTAIGLEPQNYANFTWRGFAYFGASQFAEAAEDFKRAFSLAPRDFHLAIWLHLMRAKAGVRDQQEFSRNARKLDKKAWPWPVVALYQGKMTPDDVRAAAHEGNADQQRNQTCEAAFYIGEHELAQGNSAEAVRLFQEAASSTCPREFIEYHGARAELRRLGAQPERAAGASPTR
jgi:lipoprotein NlpI